VIGWVQQDRLRRLLADSEAPIQLVAGNYDWDAERDGVRTSYALPEGIADAIATF
jgi:hypothetical protein